jgi:hypothetical protein
MAHEIFRPAGIYILTNAKDAQYQRIPIQSLGVGQMKFAWDSSIEAIVCGLEVHGENISLHLSIESLNKGEAKARWNNLGFNFTLFNLWVAGLSLDEKEQVIDDVLSWQREAQEQLINQEYITKKVA